MKVIIDRQILNLALNALHRDCEEGKKVRGEIADEIAKNIVVIEDQETFKPNAWLNLYPVYEGIQQGSTWTAHDTKEIAKDMAGPKCIRIAVPAYITKENYNKQ